MSLFRLIAMTARTINSETVR